MRENLPDEPATHDEMRERLAEPRRGIWLRALAGVGLLLVLVGVGGFFSARYWMRSVLRNSLPVVDGQVTVPGLAAPVTVARDAHGVPHIRAASLDDLLFAQGYVTAGDRLWQMESLRRFAAGELAEVVGSGAVEQDRMQRYLQLRAAADRAIAALPPDQLHQLAVYARGVNASMEEQRAHLPIEFRLLRFEPRPWVPRDSLLVGLAMYENLTSTFAEVLSREAFTAKLEPQLIADLYPVGSWRDHPVAQPPVDLTAPQPEIEQVPLDESQAAFAGPEHTNDLLRVNRLLAAASARYGCEGCLAGSNGWAVAGTKTRSGKPMLSSDMHLAHTEPEIWYMAALEGGGLNVSGVTLPGAPFVIVGHNAQVAWGFTNLGAEVQDLLVEQVRGSGANQEFQASGGSWKPVLHQHEVIHVKGAADVDLDVAATEHGGILSPILSPLYPKETRSLALRWTIYDPANVTDPYFAVNAATDWTSLCAAMAGYGGPAQNMQYADAAGHIGYHAVGRVPVRGSMTAPGAISPLPADARDPSRDWVGYIPFDQMPQAFDPAGGLVATANARVVPDGYPFPLTLDWAAPYRNERIWKVLGAKTKLVPADMLALQTDVYSDLDRVIAERLAYAIDHTPVGDSAKGKRLRQAADLLRVWDGTVGEQSAAAAIVDATRTAFWPMVLAPQLGVSPRAGDKDADALLKLYTWGNKSYAQEQILVNGPARWLPTRYTDWNALLTAAVERGLDDSHAPEDLNKLRFGDGHPVEVAHPIFVRSPLLRTVLGMATGTGTLPQSGDGTTVKQVGRSFGPSERMTVDFGALDESTMNEVLGQSGDPASEWFLDQWPAWYGGKTFAMPFSDAAVQTATRHTVTLEPRR